MADCRHVENCYIAMSQRTSSSAVTERPRDALYLSVVSFNSNTSSAVFCYLYIVTSASDLPIRAIKLCSFVFGVYSSMLMSMLNKIHWCVARRCLLIAITYSFHRRNVDDTRRSALIDAKARCWSEIAIFTYPTCIGRPC